MNMALMSRNGLPRGTVGLSVGLSVIRPVDLSFLSTGPTWFILLIPPLFLLYFIPATLSETRASVGIYSRSTLYCSLSFTKVHRSFETGSVVEVTSSSSLSTGGGLFVFS